MAKRNNNQARRGNYTAKRSDRAPVDARPTLAERAALRKPPTEYGDVFILMEDESKQVFEYLRGAWVEHAESIAECRTYCQVKELPQKVNRMTRYEVRRPI